jgi:hypothetical protein
MFTEIAEPRRERYRLEASLRRQTGEDLPSGATSEELDNLDQRLELTLGRVREMKVYAYTISAQNSELKKVEPAAEPVFLVCMMYY